MDVTVCGRPGGNSADYADLAIVAPSGVVLLDGASAFEPVDVSPVTYVHTLGKRLTAALHQHHDVPIADAVAAAIEQTTAELRLTPDASPSSTVAILRARQDAVDLYVLGDTPIYYGADSLTHRLSDERLASVAPTERGRYRDRLRAGYGYDDQHRVVLAELQRAERRARNRDGGYWIAATDLAAAHHGVSTTVGLDLIDWAVLATDGAADFLDDTGADWSAIAQEPLSALDARIAGIHTWESQCDPDGHELPRAKRHDDKTIVACRNFCESKVQG